ncbi:four-helix bundle copper-binding protein [Rufibacter sp. DG15C]|uniref:four-helix bundle copper-binding protein n=1 Tax=Rufibacter sp. DG15C TaxID=1379909 RepID=UPI00082FC03E|nr:four-helix bundle copper-binding protein [Rufibacter sp. DG15C]
MRTEYKPAIDALLACIAACDHCATACLQEEEVKKMARCIHLDLDCADYCGLAASFLSKGSEHARLVLRQCVEICEACAVECERHAHEHCIACAQACRNCIEACQELIPKSDPLSELLAAASSSESA